VLATTRVLLPDMYKVEHHDECRTQSGGYTLVVLQRTTQPAGFPFAGFPYAGFPYRQCLPEPACPAPWVHSGRGRTSPMRPPPCSSTAAPSAGRGCSGGPPHWSNGGRHLAAPTSLCSTWPAVPGGGGSVCQHSDCIADSSSTVCVCGGGGGGSSVLCCMWPVGSVGVKEGFGGGGSEVRSESGGCSGAQPHWSNRGRRPATQAFLCRTWTVKG
jgi:hypothetical protein